MTNAIIRFGKVGEKMAPKIAKIAGLEVSVSGNALAAGKAGDFHFRWGYTGDLPGRATVVNTVEAIYETCDKAKFRMKLAEAGLAPRTATDIKGFRNQQFFPVIIRPAEHQRSEHLYVANDAWDVMDVLPKVGRDFYISEKIEKEREFRVMIVNGRVVWVIEKMPEDRKAVSWGCIREGDFEYVGWDDWNKNVIENAIASFNLSKLDFGAVDVIVDKKGKAYTLEINTAPYLTTYYAETIGKAFKWIIENGKERIKNRPFKGWRDVIHPAVSKEAKV